MTQSEIIHGDCLAVLREMEDKSVDSIVTDPPYGLKFMARAWDFMCPPSDIWRECHRVLKPGGYLLAFSGTRTVDLVMGKIREAGFEIRDMLVWLYGQGFPKGGQFTTDKAVKELDVISTGQPHSSEIAAVSWNSPEFLGFGMSMKPACEPITMARKRIDKATVAANMLAWRTGAINVDGCRVGTHAESFEDKRTIKTNDVYGKMNPADYDGSKGRWPANVLLDEEAAAMLDEQSGVTKSSPHARHNKHDKTNDIYGKFNPSIGFGYPDTGGASRFFYCAKASRAEREAGLEGWPISSRFSGGLQGASIPLKGSPIPQVRNAHPTVKPISVMRWLCRLVTPPGGLIVDPFAGSGTTVIAAGIEGFSCIGIEKEEEYARIAQARVAHWLKLSPSEVAELFVPDNEDEVTIHDDKQTTFAF